MEEEMNKTLQEATDVELKAALWEIEQRSKPLQEQYQVIMGELSRRIQAQTKLGDKKMEEEVVQTEQPVEEVETTETPVEETTEEAVEESEDSEEATESEESAEEPVVEDAPSE
jgi:hypothetical protein